MSCSNFAASQIVCDESSKTNNLSFYRIENNAKVGVIITLIGGIWPLSAIKERKVELRELPGFITVTTEPDMLGLDTDSASKRAKMPCGHVIG